MNAIGVQDDGKILVGGHFTGGIERLNPDGTLDTSFTPPALDGDVKTLVIQRNTTAQYGKILIGRAFGLKRLNNPSQSSSDRSGTIGGGGSSNAVWIILIAAARLAVFSGGVTIARRCKPAARYHRDGNEWRSPCTVTRPARSREGVPRVRPEPTRR